ncbi:MAG: F0F1 ATP synthase subunit delta [Spirochaetaceae bacterium]|jgi:F0F1-type ATP synthase delta subunit|nr:F0F1 ATP synthase subunit delta [Spirochaetaceae bacterium]
MKRNFVYDRWADAFIVVCKHGGGLKLDAAQAADIREGLAVLQNAACVFSPYIRGRGGSTIAAKMQSELRAALQKCGYSGGRRAVEAALNLFFLIIKKNEVHRLGKLCQVIDSRIKELSGVLDVIVESTGEPDAAFLETLKVRLTTDGGASDVEFTCRRKSELLGGCRIIIGSERIDFSVAGYLAEMQKTLAKSA